MTLDTVAYEKVSIENCGQGVVGGEVLQEPGMRNRKCQGHREPGAGRDPARDKIWSNRKTACSTATHSFQL